MLITQTETQTEQLGRSLAAQLCPGDVLLLRGELGAGKSVFARGIARGLGIDGPVSSPTFTLMNVYEEGTIPLHHFDLYRLSDVDEFYEAGLDDYVGGKAVTLIEWPERAEGALPEAYLSIQIDYGEAEGERKIEIIPAGGFREVHL